MAATTAAERSRAARGGAIAGLIAGAVLSLFMILYNLGTDSDVWIGLKVAAFPFLHEQTMLPGFDFGAVLLGLICHFAVSIVWGTIFGLVAYGLSASATGLCGVLFGIVVWISMYYIVLPVVGAGQLTRGAPMALAVFDHLLFGISAAVAFLPFQSQTRYIDFHHVPSDPADPPH